jgi:hypothetical protein
MQRFNLATMSGVFPGTRTQIYQRVYLRSLAEPDTPPVWAQVLWYEAPTSCAVYLQEADQGWATTPLVRLVEPLDGLNGRLPAALREAGWQLESCGTCRFWLPLASTVPDGLPAGVCGWQPGGTTQPLPGLLATHSALALRCPHWCVAESAPAAVSTARSGSGAVAVAPLRKVAEISESKLRFWPRLWRRIERLVHPARSTPAWEAQLVERSGVGAGTEHCFVCQGRIANLGALAVATAAGDEQTLSIWRCRRCHTLYFNDWIDRWVRLDNLETEERYYRIAPAEAHALLQVIYNVPGGEHPGRRHERTAEGAQLLQMVAGRVPLSHQIRQGR